MTAAIASILISVFVKISPYILEQLKPLLASARSSLWKKAYPRAVELIPHFDAMNIPGLDKHKALVMQLQAELIQAGVEIDKVARLDLSTIALTAYANSPTVRAALNADPVPITGTPIVAAT